uniref:Uncharacterized protein n=1 Tax=Musa acuminata subsp. malaccensis TaxID=214687 RepID=A0A804IEC4_MUSAM
MEISSVHTDTEGLRTFLPPILTVHRSILI